MILDPRKGKVTRIAFADDLFVDLDRRSGHVTIADDITLTIQQSKDLIEALKIAVATLEQKNEPVTSLDTTFIGPGPATKEHRSPLPTGGTSSYWG